MIPHTMGCLLIDCTTCVAIFSVVTAVFFACLPAFCASRAALAYWRFSFFYTTASQAFSFSAPGDREAASLFNFFLQSSPPFRFFIVLQFHA